MGDLKQQYEFMQKQIGDAGLSRAMARHKSNMDELERLGVKQAPEPKTHRLGDKNSLVACGGCGAMYLTD